MDMDTVFTVLAIIVLVIGIALALFGRAIWDAVLSAIGGMIGWMMGFGLGWWFFHDETWWVWWGIIIAIIFGIVGSLIMAALFGILVEAALALTTGILVGAFVFYLTGEIVYALIVMGVVAVLAYVFMDRLIAIITAFIGAILAGAAVWYLKGFNLAVLAFVLLFVIGSAIQQFVLDDNTTGY